MIRRMRGMFLAVPVCALALLIPGCGDDETKPEHTELPVVEIEVTIDSVAGRFQIELYPEEAPLTAENFLRYVDDRFYEGTIFHRVIHDFIIQGGGFREGLEPVPPTYPPIPLESRNGLSNTRGTLAAARAQTPNSATSQFFINLKDNPSLDYPNPDGHGYAVFGSVIEGMDVVDSIAAVPTHAVPPHQRVPTLPIVMQSARRLNP